MRYGDDNIEYYLMKTSSSDNADIVFIIIDTKIQNVLRKNDPHFSASHTSSATGSPGRAHTAYLRTIGNGDYPLSSRQLKIYVSKS